MRPLNDLKFIANRVIEHCRANPPTEPLLGDGPRPGEKVCKRGHARVKDANGTQRCRPCERERKRARRESGKTR